MSSRRKELTDRPELPASRSPDVLTQLLGSLRLTTLVHGRLELGAPWTVRVPGDEGAHLYVVVRGGAELVAGATKATLGAGDLALLPHGGPHVLRDGKGGPVHDLGGASCRGVPPGEVLRLPGPGAQTSLFAGAFRFGPGVRATMFERLPDLVHVRADSSDAAPRLASTAQLLVAESASESPGAPLVVSRLVDVLLVQMLRTHIAGTACTTHGLQALADPHVGKALALMHEKPGDPWTVDSLATAVGASRSGFAARFAALVGEPPLAYLTTWRMGQAAELLRGDALSIAEIAERVGYGSEAAFNRAFRRHVGTPPGTYRRTARAGG